MEKIRELFTVGSFAGLTRVWTVTGGVVGLALLQMTGWWLILLFCIALGAYLGAYLAYCNAAEGLERVRDEFDTSQKARPRLVLDRVVHSEIKLSLEHLQEPSVEVWQLWFVNRPIAVGPDSTAKGLSARVAFCNHQWQVKVEFVGQWAQTRTPEQVGWKTLALGIDLEPTHQWGKLLFASQNVSTATSHVGDKERANYSVFGLSGENLLARPQDAGHPDYRIESEANRVLVRLAGTNFDEQEFRFRLVRDDRGAIAEIQSI